MVICLMRGANLHMAQLMPLPLTVSCVTKIQIGLTFLVPAHLGSPGKEPLNKCVCTYRVVNFSQKFNVRGKFPEIYYARLQSADNGLSRMTITPTQCFANNSNCSKK